MKTTVLIFMAGDNNLDISGVEDLEEMKRVRLPGHVHVAIQFDRRKALPWEDPADRATKRFMVKNQEILELQNLGETNTGDPAVLRAFIEWGVHTFPADRYLLVIWNHGGGAKDGDIYRSVMPAKGKTTLFAPKKQRKKSRFANARPSFHKNWIALDETVGVSDRYVANDDTSRDFLDNLELQQALDIPGVHFDLLAFDACLMSMLEIQYQLRSQASYILGSQEIEPPDGWPYDKVLQYLADHPESDDRSLSEAIVQLFAEGYANSKKDITQSALNSAAASTIASALQAFTQVLLDHFEQVKPRITDVLGVVQKFRDTDYIDLYDFVHLCEKNIDLPWGRHAKQVKQAIREGVVANVNKGKSVANAHGVAIYLPLAPPAKDVMDLYIQLDLHKDHGNWLKLIQTYHQPGKLIR